MLKKINIIIVSFFLILTLKGNFMFSLYLPVAFFYLLKNKNNIYYVFISSSVSIIFFLRNMIIPYLLVVLALIIVMTLYDHCIKKEIKLFSNTKLLISFFITIINIITFYLYPKVSIIWWMKLMFSLISVCIYIFLDYYLALFLNKNYKLKQKFLFNNKDTSSAYTILELLLFILASIGSSFLTIRNINLFPIVGSYFAMYLSRKYKNIYSILFGLLLILLGYYGKGIDASLVIIAISGIYLVNSIYTLVIINSYLIVMIFSKNITNSSTYVLIMLVSVVFEIISYYLIPSKEKNKLDYKDIHELAQKNVNDEILKFTNFLDIFMVGFQNPKDFNEKISIGIKTIIDKHCKNCYKQRNCFFNNKNKLYPFFKDILLLENNTMVNQIDDCPSYNSIIHTSKLLNKQENYKDSLNDNNNYMLLAQINGVSNALKNYVIDQTTKIELNYQLLQMAKEYLLELELEITYYEVVRSYYNDFLIKIGIKNKNFENVKIICESIFESITNCEVSVDLVKNNNNIMYINILPKAIIDIAYAYGNMPDESEIVSGDNYLIKELDNGHIIFTISDGMGKGYSAFYESDMALHLVDEITKLNIEPSTSLSILNTFHVVQDYLERYATLDFLDINRHNSMATIYKMGANTTYIFKKNGSVDKIYNQCLPLGIDETIEQITYQLEDEDLIIMSSDGIIENLIDNDELENFINQSKKLAPQQIVYEILNYTIRNNIKTKDDMTLIVIKVSKKQVSK